MGNYSRYSLPRHCSSLHHVMMASSRVKFSGGKIVSHSDLRAGTTREEVINKVNHGILRVGAWNVRSLKGRGRLENLKREMDRLELDIVGISEVRWEEECDFWSGDYRVIITKANHGQAGVGIVMRRRIAQRISYYEQVNERIAIVKLDTKPKPTTIVQVYMPTSSADDEVVEKIYEKIGEILEDVKSDENLIVMGDWNSVVGKGREGKAVGEYGLGIRNERGDRLVEFCAEHNLVLANTWFKHHERRLYTWMKPGDTGRYQIDFIMVRQRFRNQVLDCKTFPGADIGSDHNLLVMKCKLKLKKLTKGKKSKRWNLDKLKQENVLSSFQENVKKGLAGKHDTETVDKQWTVLRDEIVRAADEEVGQIVPVAKKHWVTKDILDLIDERRRYKNAQDELGKKEYRRLHNEIGRKCKQAKEQWLLSECKSIENNLAAGKVDSAYRKIKGTFGERKRCCMNIKSLDGKPLLSKEEKAERWKEHIETLYAGSEIDNMLEREEEVSEDETGDPILRSEFNRALKDLSRNKAAGVDNIPAELLSSLGEDVLNKLFSIVSRMYETGEVPSDFKKNVIIPIPKKVGADKCEHFRTISLVSHASKVLTRIIYRRIEKQVECELGDDQFGFRKDVGTREAILTLKLILEDRMKKNKPTFLAFIDLEKAFDNVEWNKLFEIMKAIGIKYRERRVVHNLYKNQTAVIRIEGEEREAFVHRGVRQGCNLSPLLFNVYIEKAMQEIKEKCGNGITVQGEEIKTIRFADDIVVLSESGTNLENMLNGMDSILKNNYGMSINKNKTKVMECSRIKRGDAKCIKLGNEKLKEVDQFCYLGSIIASDCRSNNDIKCRIAQARKAFLKKRDLLRANIDLKVRKSFLKMFVWSVALYGSETWTISSAEKRRIEAFEMWCYRRMLKIRWVDKVTNEEVLKRIGEKRSLWRILTKRRDRLVGHILRHEGLVKMVLEGSVWGKNTVGRPRLEYSKQIQKDVGCSNYVEMKRLAQDRLAWRVALNQS